MIFETLSVFVIFLYDITTYANGQFQNVGIQMSFKIELKQVLKFKKSYLIMVDPYQNVIAYLQLPEIPASPLYVSNQQEKWKLRKSKIKALLVLDTKIFIL